MELTEDHADWRILEEADNSDGEKKILLGLCSLSHISRFHNTVIPA